MNIVLPLASIVTIALAYWCHKKFVRTYKAEIERLKKENKRLASDQHESTRYLARRYAEVKTENNRLRKELSEYREDWFE